MGWDTDKTDIDLHVYGPEVYTLRSVPSGRYKISANYFSSHQASTSTGATSCVLWAVRNLGDFRKEEMTFRMVRLGTQSGSIDVMDIYV
jgi:hypothetical protein